jgi:hypothetical protein
MWALAWMHPISSGLLTALNLSISSVNIQKLGPGQMASGT